MNAGTVTNDETNSDKKVKTQHWSQGLVTSMDDPDSIVQQDNIVTVIMDAYPKAKYHYLILPKESISGIFKLDKTHLKLLKHMDEVANKLIVDKESTFKIGFHSVPSMQRLHLHVLSDDMVSDRLKTKMHWNSFTTKFFIPIKDLMEMIETNGSVIKIADAKHKEFMATPLKCHKCEFFPKNMPTLKTHILTHL